MLGQQSEPFLSQATFINASLVLERYPQWQLPLVNCGLAHHVERVVKSLLTTHADVPLTVLVLRFCFLQHDSPDETLGVELKDLWNFDDEILELNVHYLLVCANEHVDKLFVGDEEGDDGLESLVEV